MNGHRYKSHWGGPICEICRAALGTPSADRPCVDPRDGRIKKLEACVAELEDEKTYDDKNVDDIYDAISMLIDGDTGWGYPGQLVRAVESVCKRLSEYECVFHPEPKPGECPDCDRHVAELPYPPDPEVK